MKLLLLTVALFTAASGLSVAPALAQTGLALQDSLHSVGTDQAVGRRSHRCPGGEHRFFVPGCSGV